MDTPVRNLVLCGLDGSDLADQALLLAFRMKREHMSVDAEIAKCMRAIGPGGLLDMGAEGMANLRREVFESLTDRRDLVMTADALTLFDGELPESFRRSTLAVYFERDPSPVLKRLLSQPGMSDGQRANWNDLVAANWELTAGRFMPSVPVQAEGSEEEEIAFKIVDAVNSTNLFPTIGKADWYRVAFGWVSATERLDIPGSSGRRRPLS